MIDQERLHADRELADDSFGKRAHETVQFVRSQPCRVGGLFRRRFGGDSRSARPRRGDGAGHRALLAAGGEYARMWALQQEAAHAEAVLAQASAS